MGTKRNLRAARALKNDYMENLKPYCKTAVRNELFNTSNVYLVKKTGK